VLASVQPGAIDARENVLADEMMGQQAALFAALLAKHEQLVASCVWKSRTRMRTKAPTLTKP
jgi:hypothetical protein